MLIHKLRPMFLLLLALATGLAGCAHPATSQAPSALAGSRFAEDTAHCPWSTADLRAQLTGLTIRCGIVNVPEFHSHPDGVQLKLAVLVGQHDPGRSSPDAIIYLAGGPGNSVEPAVLLNFWPAGRDVIVFDERGVGNSVPALNCSAVGGRDPFTAANESRSVLAACRDQLVNQGVHLAAYTIPEMAADVNDIRRALGYSQLDLFGLSYGTKLALTVLRDYPQSVRSAVLDSVLPMQADVIADLPSDVERSLNRVLDACGADPGCRWAHPDLGATFFRLMADLNRQPAVLAAGSNTITLTGASLARLLPPVLLSGPGQFTGFVDGPSRNDFSQLSQWLSQVQAPSDATAWVMSYSVVCSDRSYGSPSSAATTPENVPAQLSDVLRAEAQSVADLCASWPVPTLPLTTTLPVSSAVPTLLLEGTFDPITPPAYGRLAAQTLSHSFYIEFPDRGHAVLRGGDECSQKLVNQFFEQPDVAPDASCAAALRPMLDAAQGGKLGSNGFSLSRDKLLSAAAPSLRLTIAQLDQALASGQSLAQVAAEQGVDLALVRQALWIEIQTELDAQVQAGALSRADAAVISQKFEQSGLDELLNGR